MVEKITVALSAPEALGSLLAATWPVIQNFSISFGTTFKVKRKKVTHETVLTWTPMLVGLFAVIFHFGLLTPNYFNEVRFSQPMPSGAWFIATGGDLLVFFALCVLATDILTIWKIKRKNHVNRRSGGFWVSLFVFIISAWLFFVSANVGSGIFLILLIMSLTDLLLWSNIFVRY